VGVNPAWAVGPPGSKEVKDRHSWGRKQPYAGHSSQFVPQLLPQPTGQPQHTFFRHNAGASLPFDWLVHLDRPLTSPMELLHVSGFRPHELTQQFRTATAGFAHRAPWLDEDLAGGDGSHRLYRALEFLGIHSRVTGAGERVPGRINLNTVWDEETFLALCDPNSSNFFNDGQARKLFGLLKKSRTTDGKAPGPNDRPFRGWAVGVAPGGDSQWPGGSGLQDTLLRCDPPGQPILAIPGQPHPYLTFELLTKICNNVTVRSNVFAVWVTAGFFEVIDETARPVKLGAELGAAERREVRHRLFAVVDRSVLTRNPGPRPRFDPHAPPPPFTTGPIILTYRVD
jgi:hypothetical protein